MLQFALTNDKQELFSSVHVDVLGFFLGVDEWDLKSGSDRSEL